MSRHSSRSRRRAGRCSRGSLEIGRLLSVNSVEMVRYEADRVAVVMAAGTRSRGRSIGTRVPLEAQNLTGVVFRAGRTVRLDDSGGPSPSV
jgi:hypothetical protein